MQIARAAVVLFVASFCTLVIEIVAGRLMAPYVGVSLYTWTSIIGIVLAGISAGAWGGGWLADRRPRPSTLGWLLLAAGAAAFTVAPLIDLLASDGGLLDRLELAQSLVARVVVLSTLVFFLPSFLLGMISPVAVKLAVRDLASTGRVVGRLYAVSTIGSIAGTYVTGFFLIAHYGTRATLVGVGVCLLLAALLFGGFLGRSGRTAVAVVALAVGLWLGVEGLTAVDAPPRPALSPLVTGTMYEEESQYYTLRVERTVREDNGAPLLALHLDHLTHSYSDPSDPAYLEYGYLRIFAEVARWQSRSGDPRFLFLGGGGYTLPRYLEVATSNAAIDVVEIDPAVTRTAVSFLGLSPESAIRTFNEDARWYVMRTPLRYDAVFVDVFNDLSVPYHLTTEELNRQLGERLTWDGVVAANVIDNFQRGRFLPSYIRTMQEVFGRANVALVMESSEDMEALGSTFVVLASPRLQPLLDSFGLSQTFQGHVLHGQTLERYLRRARPTLLTDDYAPVDNMLAARFAERFIDE